MHKKRRARRPDYVSGVGSFSFSTKTLVKKIFWDIQCMASPHLQ
jgi:hypothetical protein